MNKLYNVAIIEDEDIIRNALTHTICWQDLQCSVVATFSSGEDFVEWFQKNRGKIDIHIVITDLRMNKITGIDVAKFIHEQETLMKVIIITGYGELEYAKKAISYNVKGFILKPINPVELSQAIFSAVQELQEAYDLQSTLTDLRTRVLQDLPLLRHQYIAQLIHAGKSHLVGGTANEEFLQLNFDSYVVVCLSLSDYATILNKRGILEVYEWKQVILAEVGHGLHAYDYYSVVEKDDTLIFVVFRIHLKEVENIFEQVAELLYTRFQLSVDIGISNGGKSSADIGKIVTQARTALNFRFHTGKNSVNRYDEIPKTHNTDNITPAVISEVSFEHVLSNVQIGNTEEAIEQLKLLWKKVIIHFTESTMKNVFCNLMLEYNHVISQNNLVVSDFQHILEVLRHIEQSVSRSQAFAYVCNITEQVSREMSTIYISSSHQIFTAATEYIKQNYMNHITLKDVADQALVSEKYLCKILKAKTGKTFKEIQGQYIVEASINLIQTTQLKTYEIAEKMGFSDARYFGQLFKKITGKTLREFKQGG